MKKFLKSKLLILIILGIFILDLTNDFSLVDIKETALVVALGVDKQDDEYEVSAQIAVPQATDQAASNKSTVISGKGKTIALALKNIGSHTGWYIKLAFCNVIILGEGIFDDDVMVCLDYFIRTDRINDSAELCAAEGSAKEIVSAVNPMDQLSAFSLTKILERSAESASAVAFMNMKEFAMGYYDKSGFSAMPIIKLIPTDGGESSTGSGGGDSQSGGGSSSGSGGGNSQSGGGSSSGSGGDSQSGGGSSSGSGGGDSKEKIFDATTTALFSNGKRVMDFTSEQTLTYNLLSHKSNETSFPLKNVDDNGKNADIVINIRDNRSKKTLKIEDGVPVLHIKLSINVRIEDSSVVSDPKELSTGYAVQNNVITALEKDLEKKYKELFELTRAADCDIFEIKNKLYRTHNNYYEGLKDIVLRDADVKVEIDAKSYK